MLESFVFISGFLFGCQEKKNGRKPIGVILLKKGKRLLIPSFIFSILYFFFFQYSGSLSMNDIYEWMIGTAHMWFLPMLFLCFLVVAIIRKTMDRHLKEVVVISIFLSVFSFLTLPFRLDKMMEYLPFFVIGYAIGYKEYKYFPVKGWKLVFLFLISFIAFTLLNRYLREIKDDYSTLIRMGIYAFMNVGKLVYSALGVMLVYTTMNIGAGSRWPR